MSKRTDDIEESITIASRCLDAAESEHSDRKASVDSIVEAIEHLTNALVMAVKISPSFALRGALACIEEQKERAKSIMIKLIGD